jgi:tetratricopeptide (TPR) repeat protein
MTQFLQSSRSAERSNSVHHKMRLPLATLTLIWLLGACNATSAQTQLEGQTANRQDDLKTLIEHGDAQRSGGKYAECIESYTKAIALMPNPKRDDFTVFYFRGICNEKYGNWPDAERDLKRALELHPDQPLVLNYLAYVWADRGVHLDEALRMLRRAVEQRPDDGYVLDSLG